MASVAAKLSGVKRCAKSSNLITYHAIVPDLQNIGRAKRLGHAFDLSKRLNLEEYAKTRNVSLTEFLTDSTRSLEDNTSELIEKLTKCIYNSSPKNIRRIVILNFSLQISELTDRVYGLADFIFNIRSFDKEIYSKEAIANPLDEYDGMLTVFGGLPWMGFGNSGSLEPALRPLTLTWTFKLP
ncbi:unnamed protein product [Protopolystoma xenopodis]|uniref:Uncharacterized protein n=1 Tax=Protopolystoma xenopodis TaxID=117903 RepID=A0A3S5ANY8_9PLAT|nr:unnamed protein product [Protopolystoma xenopodis]